MNDEARVSRIERSPSLVHSGLSSIIKDFWNRAHLLHAVLAWLWAGWQEGTVPPWRRRPAGHRRPAPTCRFASATCSRSGANDLVGVYQGADACIPAGIQGRAPRGYRGSGDAGSPLVRARAAMVDRVLISLGAVVGASTIWILVGPAPAAVSCVGCSSPYEHIPIADRRQQRDSGSPGPTRQQRSRHLMPRQSPAGCSDRPGSQLLAKGFNKFRMSGV